MKKLIFLLFSVFALFPFFAYAELKWSEPVNNKTFTEAVIYCSKLKENGVSDWQLPTTDELSSFNAGSGNYWSSDANEELNKNKQYADDEDKAWFYNFSTKKKTQSLVSTRMKVVCVRNVTVSTKPKQQTKPAQNPKPKAIKKDETKSASATASTTPPDPKDKNACEFAREKNNIDAWNFYRKEFPEGSCRKEAEDAIKRYLKEELRKAKEEEKAKEAKLYAEAKKLNTRAAWEKYLREFPKGEHSFEAEYNKNQMKKVGDLEWSDLSSQEMKWWRAPEYCENLTEDGHNDWRFPNIDELRTLIQNCPTTEQDGKCKTNENYDLFSCFCQYKENGYYSKLGDDETVGLWSSSTHPEFTDSLWIVGFHEGLVITRSNNSKYFVRCVRDLK